MESLWSALTWISKVLLWIWLIWFSAAFVIGGAMLALDQWRFHRTMPKPEAVRAHAIRLLDQHGRDAYRINGEAMDEARLAKDYDRYQFLKEVSGELVSRLR
jgi:hypothetical protein